MHVLEYLHRNVKTVAMPSAMVAGALLCRPVTALEAWTHQMITPSLIFLMLFVTFCRVKPRQMKPSMLHVWLLQFQVVVSAALYFALLPLDAIVAQGAMICVLAPVAMAAVGIAGMLGANVPTMATYSPNQFDPQAALEQGILHTWIFGPRLLDDSGKALASFDTWDYIKKVHPAPPWATMNRDTTVL